MQFSKNNQRNFMFRSGDKGIRTLDPLLAKQVLSQLSYTPAFSRFGFRCPLCFEGFVYGMNPQDPQN